MSVTNTMPKNVAKVLTHMAEKLQLGVERSLEVVRNEMLPNTPVVTGRLISSLGGQSASANVSIEGDKVQGTKWSKAGIMGWIGTNVPYAKKVEFGPNKRASKGFMTRSLESAKPKIVPVIVNTLNEKDANPT